MVWRLPGNFLEYLRKMALGAETEIKRDLMDTDVRVPQKILSPAHLFLLDVLLHRHMFLYLKQMGQIVRIHMQVSGDIRDLDRVMQVGKDVILDARDQRIPGMRVPPPPDFCS